MKQPAVWTKRLGLSFFFFIGLLAMPKVSFAHLVELISSFPQNGMIMSQSPGVITAVFNEEMQSKNSSLQVFDAAGNQVDNGDGGVDLNDPDHASLQVNVPALAEGAYTVRWQVMLLDGDATRGSFNFFVGEPAAANAANFLPMPVSADGVTTAVTATDSNNTLWLAVGTLATIIFISGALFAFFKRKPAA